jgi:hypothetical protein
MDMLAIPHLGVRPFAMSDLAAAQRLLDLDLHWSTPRTGLARRSWVAGVIEPPV